MLDMGTAQIKVGSVTGTLPTLQIVAKTEPWLLLGIAKDASKAEARKAYRGLSRIFYEDVFAEEAARLGIGPGEVFKAISLARAAFDSGIPQQGGIFKKETSADHWEETDSSAPPPAAAPPPQQDSSPPHGLTPDLIARFERLVVVGVQKQTALGAFIIGKRPPTLNEMAKYLRLGLTPELVQGYCQLHLGSDEEMVAFKAHGVTPEFIRRYNDTGFKFRNLNDFILLRHWGITPEFVCSLARSHNYQYKKPEIGGYFFYALNPRWRNKFGQSMVELDKWFKNKGLTPDLVVRHLRAGNSSLDDMARCAAFNISPEFFNSIGPDEKGLYPSFGKIARLQKKSGAAT